MAELARNVLKLKNVMNKSKNRNTRFVNVRSVRNCRYCGRSFTIKMRDCTVGKRLLVNTANSPSKLYTEKYN